MNKLENAEGDLLATPDHEFCQKVNALIWDEEQATLDEALGLISNYQIKEKILLCLWEDEKLLNRFSSITWNLDTEKRKTSFNASVKILKEQWELDDSEIAALLRIPYSWRTIEWYQDQEDLIIENMTLFNISCILGIWKNLWILFDQESSKWWIKRDNEHYWWISALKFILKNPSFWLYSARLFLDWVVHG